jgi:hypothetical protein
MTTREKQLEKDRMSVANAVALVGASGSFITDDLVEWVVLPEKIAEVQRTHFSCIPNATSGWNETVPLPTTWAIWWLSRLTHAKHQSGCGMAGSI